MEINDITITKREILVSIIILLILITIGLFISNGIEDSINEKNEKYYKSLKIDYDTEKFKYAINTNIGYTLARGKVKAVEGVSISDIEGTYLKISKVREEYTRHTREVAHTRTKSDGTTETYYETEVYYTWDYAGKEEFNSENFEFLEVKFKNETIRFSNEKYKKTIYKGLDVRYVYYVIPVEFEGCLFTNIKNNTINENEFYYNTKIEEVIEQKQAEYKSFKIGFWMIWILLINRILIASCPYSNIELFKRNWEKVSEEEVEKSADEMFEELGYRVFVNNGFNLFEYVKHYELRPAKHIKFEIDKTITIAQENEKELAVRSDNITMQELQAINKKVEELGWK